MWKPRPAFLKHLYMTHKAKMEYVCDGTVIICFAKFNIAGQVLYLIVADSGELGSSDDIAFFCGDDRLNLDKALKDENVKNTVLAQRIWESTTGWVFPVIETTWPQ